MEKSKQTPQTWAEGGKKKRRSRRIEGTRLSICLWTNGCKTPTSPLNGSEYISSEPRVSLFLNVIGNLSRVYPAHRLQHPPRYWVQDKWLHKTNGQVDITALTDITAECLLVIYKITQCDVITRTDLSGKTVTLQGGRIADISNWNSCRCSRRSFQQVIEWADRQHQLRRKRW